MRSVALFVVAVLWGGTFGVSWAQGPWKPFVAKQKRTYLNIAEDGTETVIEVHQGQFLRSSSGVELQTEHHLVDGVLQPGSGLLIDRPRGESYQLVYGPRKALLRSRAEPNRGPFIRSEEDTREAKAKALGERVVNGMWCLDIPVMSMFVGEEGQERVGVACRSLDYDITVYRNRIQKTLTGRMRIIDEMYDIRTGIEPDDVDLRIPKEFKLIDDITEIGSYKSGCKLCGSKNTQ